MIPQDNQQANVWVNEAVPEADSLKLSIWL